MVPPRMNALLRASIIGLLAISVVSLGDVRINEVADKGTFDDCSGNDWIELYLPADVGSSVRLDGYVLHDDNGPFDGDALNFTNTVINPGQYMLLCNRMDGDANSPQFGIGVSDTLTLISPDGSTVWTTGALTGGGEEGNTHAWDENSLSYLNTAYPTAGSANVFRPAEVVTEDYGSRMSAINAAGEIFFDMDADGLPVDGGLDEIVDLRLDMDPGEVTLMMENQSYEMPSPFTGVTITKKGDPNDVLLRVSSTGLIIPEGQTLDVGTCLDFTAIPFTIDIDHVYKTDSVYGVQKMRLRNHLTDSSYLREWTINRMLARFGLPHLRTRKVRFFVNEEYFGLYDLMEAPDQDYVFYRSFPELDPDDGAVYNVKTESDMCGSYDDVTLGRARARMDGDTNGAPPYSFQTGTHRDKMPVLGFSWENLDTCIATFMERTVMKFEDTALAYLRADRDCGEMLVDESLVERVWGGSLGNSMEKFIDSNLGGFSCDEDCLNSDLIYDVDVDNFLKTFAVYAALNNMESLVGSGRQYYLAGGNDDGWKIISSNWDNAGTAGGSDMCHDSCKSKSVNWSILRPTCRDLTSTQLVGPLLSDPKLHEQYIDYVRQFVSTVMTDPLLIERVHAHAEAIENEVLKDDWSYEGGIPYVPELSTNPEEWNYDHLGSTIISFVPFLLARADSIESQLASLDDGTFPRGPHLSKQVHPYEVCVDWKLEDYTPICQSDCYYEGCHEDSFTATAYCDEASKVCYHGDLDQKCANVENGQQYAGMSMLDAFSVDLQCVDTRKVTQCPPDLTVDAVDAALSSCHENCKYDGCHDASWTLSSYCNERTGTCYHGNRDENCKDVKNGEKYEGMTNLNTFEQNVYCWERDGAPIKMSKCPAPPTFDCPDDCRYEGCHLDDFVLPSLCNEGTCYHADYDFNCKGIPNGELYEGMTNLDGSDRAGVCWEIEGMPTQYSECPALKPAREAENGGSSSAASGGGFCFVFLSVVSVVASLSMFW